MTCQELIEFLTAYLDGQLPLSQRLAFARHLTLCRECRAYLHNFKTTIAAAKQVGDDAAEMPEDLVKTILSSRNAS